MGTLTKATKTGTKNKFNLLIFSRLLKTGKTFPITSQLAYKNSFQILSCHYQEQLLWIIWYLQLLRKCRILTHVDYPERRLGSLSFIRFLICWARASTKAILPSLFGAAPVSIDLRLSLSALQAVSNELSEPVDPDCVVAIETDWPIKATQGISDAFAGPLFDSIAWTAARDFWSDAAWSILLIIPMVLVPINTILLCLLPLVSFNEIKKWKD